MAVQRSAIMDRMAEEQQSLANLSASDVFSVLVQGSQYVGEVYSMGYETALVQIHDYFRKQVGGIPSLSFLIATRIDPQQPLDH